MKDLWEAILDLYRMIFHPQTFASKIHSTPFWHSLTLVGFASMFLAWVSSREIFDVILQARVQASANTTGNVKLVKIERTPLQELEVAIQLLLFVGVSAITLSIAGLLIKQAFNLNYSFRVAAYYAASVYSGIAFIVFISLALHVTNVIDLSEFIYRNHQSIDINKLYYLGIIITPLMILFFYQMFIMPVIWVKNGLLQFKAWQAFLYVYIGIVLGYVATIPAIDYINPWLSKLLS